MRIEVYSDSCKIFDIDDDTRNTLDQLLTKEVEGAEYVRKKNKGKGWDGKYRFYNRLSNTFKTGLLPYVLTLLEQMSENPSIIEKRWLYPLEDCDIVPLKVMDQQGRPVQALYRPYQLESIKLLSKNAGGLIHIATNGGKSLIIAGFILSLLRKSPMKALVLVHRIEIFKQLKELFDLNYDPALVGTVASKEDGGIRIQGKQIVFAMVQTLSRRLGKFKKGKDPGKITDEDESLRNFLQEVSIYAIDEVHHANATTYKDAVKSAKKCLIHCGFSGTIGEADTLEGLQLRSLLGCVVRRVKNIELIEKGVSLIPKVFFYCVELDGEYLEAVKKHARKDHYIKRLQSEDEKVRETPHAGMGGYQFQKLYEEGVIYNEEQNQVLLETVTLLSARGLQTLVVVDRKETHGKHLSEMFDKAGLKHLVWTGDTKDRSGVLKQFQTKQVNLLIATSVMNEGVNVHAIDVIILASGLKSTIALLQRAGRGLRTGSSNDYLLIIDFLHVGEDTLYKHSKTRAALWNDEGFSVRFIDTIEDFIYYLTDLGI